MVNPLVSKIERIQEEILDACGSIDVTETHSINDMAVPEFAYGNCGFAAERAIVALSSYVFPHDVLLTYTGIQTPAGNHYGVLVSEHGKPQEESIIIDFTARQFDKNMPFPLIMDCWEWQRWVESKIGRIGNWYHSYDW